MARTLYRIYLYFVFTVLLSFAAVTSAMFLGDIFRQMGGNSNPYGGNAADLRQPGALAVVALVVTAIFGGLHYWLIRRDIAHDPGASRGAVRAFFLNFTEAVSAIVVVSTGASGLSSLNQPGYYYYYAAGNFGPVVAFAVLFALLELERRRGQPDRGGALVLQRLHFYGVQLILLFFMASYGFNALYQTVAWLILKTGYASNPCLAQNNYGGCYLQTAQNLGAYWLAALGTVAIWAGYSLLSRADHTSRLRAVFRFLGLAFGVSYILSGFQQGVDSLLRAVFNAPIQYPPYQGVPFSYENALVQFAFVSPLVLGLFVAVVYWLWLQSDARHGGVMNRETTLQSMMAVAAALSAFPFYGGIALTLGGLVERSVSNGSPPNAATWAGDIAAIIAGAAYVPLALWLGARARRTGVSTPRRAFVYVLLAFGTLGAVISLIFVLYAFVSNSLGTPLNNWEQLARQGVANVVVGAIIVGIYVFLARREGWFVRQPAHAEATTPAPAHMETLEGVLDELLAQRISRDEAAARIRALTTRTTQ